MRIKHSLRKRRPIPARKVKVSVDPDRVAVAALERIRTVLVRMNQAARFGPPTPLRELAERARIAGRPLPPSYVAAMRITSEIGDPVTFLSAAEMEDALRSVQSRAAPQDGERYIPFARLPNDVFLVFDQKAPAEHGELGIAECGAVAVRPIFHHFGEWLDSIADEREDDLDRAANLPKGLKDLLLQLGFEFQDPVVGTLTTGDVLAIESLIGEERAHQIRGEYNRLFDSTGKAKLILHLDEFTLSCALRTGTLFFPADDVFRWLRTFRDENFFGDSYREPSHPDETRDLRKAPREPPLVVRGSIDVGLLPAQRHFFCDAAGLSERDFYVLGRGIGMDRTTSLLLHFYNGSVSSAQTLDQALHSIHVSEDGCLWGLTNQGLVLRFHNNKIDMIHLPRAAGSLTWWYGIGEYEGRILVWGTGALVEVKNGDVFPFEPTPGLEKHEAVTAVRTGSFGIHMLVSDEIAGAIARFDGRAWAPIREDQMVEGELSGYDVWRGQGLLAARNGRVWIVEHGDPRVFPVPAHDPALFDEEGERRPVHGICGIDGGALLPSDGGILALQNGEAVFFRARSAFEPARLIRIGRAPAGPITVDNQDEESSPFIIAVFGRHAWLWRDNGFTAFDMRAY